MDGTMEAASAIASTSKFKYKPLNLQTQEKLYLHQHCPELMCRSINFNQNQDPEETNFTLLQEEDVPCSNVIILDPPLN